MSASPPPEAVILIGIQACGKSTFVRRHLFDTHVRINLDMLRTRPRERHLLDACLAGGTSFVIDNTNPTRADRARYLVPAAEIGFRRVGYYFRSSIRESLRRNARRGDEARIPQAGIRGTHARLELPTLAEGFDALHYVRIADGEFRIEDWSHEVQ